MHRVGVADGVAVEARWVGREVMVMEATGLAEGALAVVMAEMGP
jgi:hypothetical protein